MKYLKQIIALLVIVLSFSCDENENTMNSETAVFSVKLIDDPGDYENVYVEVIDVMVKYESDNDIDQEEEGGWESIGIINPGIYDLLELTGGVSLQLIENEEIETGTIKQIRLLLGDENSVVLEGETEALPLNTPSGQQSGLKVMVNQEILAGFNYDFILDFDVDESIVMAGNSGNINLKPVLRANLEFNSGSLSGMILPLGIAVEIEVTNGLVSASTMTDAMGNFEILGLPEGLYTLTITPDDDSLLIPITIPNVEVVVGETTILETVTLE